MFIVTVDADKCTGCGECVSACPAQVFEMPGDVAEVNGNDCLGCESCVLLCPVEAITLNEY